MHSDGVILTPFGYTGLPARQESAMEATTAKRLTTRVTGHALDKLQHAADLVGATLNQFVVQAALDKAERVIESENTVTLTRRESLRLLELLENPPPPNERLQKLMDDYRKMNADGSHSSIEWTPR